MTLNMFITFGSAFLGRFIFGRFLIPIIHWIFPLGAFIAGLIVREGGLAIMITENLKDMVSIIFLLLCILLFMTSVQRFRLRQV